MSQTLSIILDLIDRGDVRVSDHGYDELAADGILASEIVDATRSAQVIEDYPDYPKGPCVLVFLKGYDERPIHALWGVPRNHSSPAVLITAYRPDPRKWSSDFLRRVR